MNSNLQNKLTGYEATPPAGAWDRIAEALDEGYIFPEKLYQYEQAPKADVWQKIETALENETARVVPITRRFKKPMRYIAVAAAVIAAVFIGATLLGKKGTLDTITTASQVSAPFKEQQNSSPRTSEKNQVTPSAKTISSPLHVQDESISYNKNVERQLKAPKRLLAFFPSFPSNENRILLKKDFIPREPQPASFFDFSSVNDYMVYSDDDGNAVRLPKKLFSLVNCPAGDLSCKERIQQLQQKLLSNSLSTDFAGILEMLRQLQ